MFKTYYNALVAQIASTKAKGVIANIPDVTTIPFINNSTLQPAYGGIIR